MIFENDKKRKAAYSLVFRSMLARRVLADIVDQLGLWSMKEQGDISAQAQVEMITIAKRILSDAGAWKEIYSNIFRKETDGRRNNWFRRLFRR